MKEIEKKIEELKQAKLIKLTPENLRDLDNGPGAYVIYNNPDPKQRPLYVGSTSDLGMRFGQIVGTINFDHTFTFRLVWREAERVVGRQYTKKELLTQFWFDNRNDREKIVMKIEKLLNKLWFKYVELEGWKKEDYEELEKKVQRELKPLNPHLRDSCIPLDDLFVS